MSSKVSKKFIISSLFAVVLLILVLIPWKNIVQNIAIEQIDKQGFGPSKLEVSSLGATGIVVSNISVLGDGVQISQLEIDWTITGLFQKKISDIRISGVSVDPKAFPKSESSSSKKDDGALNFDDILAKVPTEKISLDLTTPENLSGYSLSKSPVVINFDKSLKKIELDLPKGLKVQNEALDVSLRPFKLVAIISASKIVLTPQKMQSDIVYTMDKKLKSFVRFDELVLSDKSVIELISTSDGILPGVLALEFKQARGAFGENNANWGQIDLKSNGEFKNLNLKGSVKNINHVGSKCLYGIDLDFKATKTDNFSFVITSPKSRKDLALNVKGSTGSKIHFSLNSNLKNVDFKKTFPCVGKDISEVKGDLSVSGYVNLGKKKGERLDVSLKGAGFNWEEMKVNGVDINSNVVSFSTFAGSTPSEVKIKKVGLAFDLNDISLRYLVSPDKVKVEGFDLKVLEGKLWSEPFELDRKSNTTENLIINVDDLPLNDVLKVGLKDAVEATGKLRGSLPISWIAQTPVVKAGVLETKDNGILRYNPKTINPLEKTGNLNVNMLSDYLKDFRYSKLGIDVDSDEKYNLQMKAKILGVNPAVNNGRPLKFGFNLGLDIKNALISYLALMKIPKKMEQNFLKKLQK
ncbi:MAG: hypothetical protein EP319_09250 [Deltaproteobacteria bacterium]|nr:MAG: hypothetical protein EP319_09250 [Deltaproteobacteria bacterium]